LRTRAEVKQQAARQLRSAADTAREMLRFRGNQLSSAAEVLIWRVLLGLRLTRGRSPATVAGWRISGRGADWVRLEAASWFLTGNLLVLTADGRVSLATFLHYERRVGRWVWPPLSALHRRLVPGVLRSAAARSTRKPASREV